MRTRVLLADHAELALLGLRQLLSGVHQVELAGEARDAVEMQALIVRHRPHVVLVDHTSEGFGAGALRTALQRSPRTRFLAITPEPSAATLMNALRAGVTSFVRKDCGLQEIVDAVLHTAQGERFFCGKVLDTLRRASVDVDRFTREPLSCDPVVLSERECQVIALIAEGRSYTQIAGQLHISAHTVNTHRRNIMQKLGVNNKAAVVMYALKNGLASPNKYLFASVDRG